MEKLIFAKNNEKEIGFYTNMINRHGLIAGATGTGKTITLQVLAENFSRNGIPVFMADIKGDISGISMPGKENDKILERIRMLNIQNHKFESFPVVFWDLYGIKGHKIRTTISDMGPLLLSRLLNLNETQSGTLSLIFKIADDNRLLLLDFKDLKSMIQYVGDNLKEFITTYGNISQASIGVIQRALYTLEEQKADQFFGEPSLNIDDFIQTDNNGYGFINILSAEDLMQSPKIYSTFLLWFLSELFEKLPEVGDLEKPKIVFFFDEAHLLFNDIPKILLEKIEQVVRLIRSKGVGIYFVTQNPLDIPLTVLAQLGNRIQHALRAFTPKDQKNIKAVSETFRANPKIKTDDAIIELSIGEALISLLDQNGQPEIVERAFIYPPKSQIGPISDEERNKIIKNSILGKYYDKTIDRESAYEILQKYYEERKKEIEKNKNKEIYQYQDNDRRRNYKSDSTIKKVVKTGATSLARSASYTIGKKVGEAIIRGILGSILGK